MKRLFGDLCCKEGEIVSFYKDMLKNDKKFASFMKVIHSMIGSLIVIIIFSRALKIKVKIFSSVA